jgi:hypothetical protein
MQTDADIAYDEEYFPFLPIDGPHIKSSQGNGQRDIWDTGMQLARVPDFTKPNAAHHRCSRTIIKAMARTNRDRCHSSLFLTNGRLPSIPWVAVDDVVVVYEELKWRCVR